MIIWGGTDISNELNSGGRYNRGANSWSALSSVSAPSPRTEHTAVWDGTRMIVWGGSSSNNTLNTGGIYNPLTDGWAATEVGTNAPPARGLHAAVWTGTEMVVHGGYTEAAFQDTFLFRDDTWHYTAPRTMFLYLKP
jgi:N-acetylneuraminic acid mutarotase